MDGSGGGTLGISRSVFFWYLLISMSALVPGRYLEQTLCTPRSFILDVVSSL